VLAQKEQKNVKEKMENYLVFRENLLKNDVLILKALLCVHRVHHINIAKFIYYNYKIGTQQWLLITEQLHTLQI
jgi:hypothetical protein